MSTAQGASQVPDLKEARPVLVFPQIADGGGISSEIILTNSGSQDELGTLRILDGSGNPLPLSFSGLKRSSINFVARTGGALKIQTDGEGAAKAGYVLLESKKAVSQLAGSIIYTFGGFEVSVPSSETTYESHLLAETSDSSNSGIALVNAEANPVSIEVFVLDTAGKLKGQKEIRLEGGEQKPQFITQIFDGLGSDFLGSFHARAGSRVGAIWCPSQLHRAGPVSRCGHER